MNEADLNILLYAFLGTYTLIYLRYVPRGGIIGS